MTQHYRSLQYCSLLLLLASTSALCGAQKPTALATAAQTPIAEFDQRVASYMKIHKVAAHEAGGGVATTKSAEQLNDKRRAIADGILARRKAAAQGDIFTTAIAAEFRRLIQVNLKHKSNAVRTSIKSDEQGTKPVVRVNGAYPENAPLETMPPTLLMALPKLPSELDYRLIGTTLILRDTVANLVIDILPNALPGSLQ
jgi:hypothetical protein